jgi:hypothetical protein
LTTSVPAATYDGDRTGAKSRVDSWVHQPFSEGEITMTGRAFPLPVLLGALLSLTSSSALGQYRLTVLDSNQEGQATHNPDPLLVNAWGLARTPTSFWWVSDNTSGWATVYDGTGAKQGLEVEISPAPSGGPIGMPTGIVANPSTNLADFHLRANPAVFIFATLDGTIAAWGSRDSQI